MACDNPTVPSVSKQEPDSIGPALQAKAPDHAPPSDQNGDVRNESPVESRFHPYSSSSKQKKTVRTRTPSACERCKLAKAKCSELRPCPRCVKFGESSTCFTNPPEVQHKVTDIC